MKRRYAGSEKTYAARPDNDESFKVNLYIELTLKHIGSVIGTYFIIKNIIHTNRPLKKPLI